MNNQDNSVMKALSPEEMTVLSNIKSSIDEILQMGGGSVMSAEPIQEKPEDQAMAEKKIDAEEPAIEPDKEKKSIAKKGVVETPSDSATGDSPAEERMEEVLTEQTQDNKNEVARSLAIIAKKLLGEEVKKSAPKNPMVDALNSVAKAIENINKKVEIQGNVIEQLLDGMGISEQLEVVQKSQERKPVVSTDNQQVVKFLQEIVGQVRKSEDAENDEGKLISSQSMKVNKNLKNPAMYQHLMGDAFSKFDQGE